MVRAWSTAIAFVLLINIYTSIQFPATTKVNRNVIKFKRKTTTQPDGRIFDFISNDQKLHALERRGFYKTPQQTEISAKFQQDITKITTATKTILIRNKRVKKREIDETHLTTEAGKSSPNEKEKNEGKIDDTTVKTKASTSDVQKVSETLESTLHSATMTIYNTDNKSAHIPGIESTLPKTLRTSGNAENTEGTIVVGTTNVANFSILTSNNKSVSMISGTIDMSTTSAPNVSTLVKNENSSTSESTPNSPMKVSNTGGNESAITVKTDTPGNTVVSTTNVANSSISISNNKSVTTISGIIDISTTSAPNVSTLAKNENISTTESTPNSAMKMSNTGDNGGEITVEKNTTGSTSTLDVQNRSKRTSRSAEITEGNTAVSTTDVANSSISTSNNKSVTTISGIIDMSTTFAPNVSTLAKYEHISTTESTPNSAMKMSNTGDNGSEITVEKNSPGRTSTLDILPGSTRTSRDAEITEGNTAVSTTDDVEISFLTSNNETTNSDSFDNYNSTTELSVSMNGGKEKNNMTDISNTTFSIRITDTTVSDTLEGNWGTPSSTAESDRNSSNGIESMSEEKNQNENLSQSSTIATEGDELTTNESLTTKNVSNTTKQTQFSDQNVTNEENTSTTPSVDMVSSNSDYGITMRTGIPTTTNVFNTLQSFHTDSASTEPNITNKTITIGEATAIKIAAAETENVTRTSELISVMEKSTTPTYKEIQITSETIPTTQWTKEMNCRMQQGNVTITCFESNRTYFKIYFESNFNPDCVDEYIVKYQENIKAVLEQTTAMNKTFEMSGLSPCTMYRVSVDAVTNFGNFSSNIINITTEYHMPGEIENLTYNLSSHTLHASWNPPSIAPNCVEGYSVVLTQSGDKQPKVVENVTDTNIIISDLYSCTNYTLKIKPIGVESYGNETKLHMKPTDHEAPPAPIDFTEVTSDSRSIKGTWILPDTERTKYGCGFSALSMTCHRTDVNLVVSTGTEVNRSSNHTTLQLPSLEPNKQYKCFSKLNNSFSLFSIETSSFYLHTQEEVPDPPQNLTIMDVTSESITVEWEPQMWKKANITGYNVQISCKNDPIRSSCNSSSVRCPEPLINITVNDTKLTIYKLTPNTQYNIVVAAIAKIGTGGFSNPLPKTTLPAAAGPVLNLNVNILPSKPNSDVMSIDASWESPCLTSGTFGFYEVKLYEKREQYPPHIITQNASDTKITIKPLKFECNYTLEVRTHYSDLQSTEVATVHHFNTEATIPASKETPENKIRTIPYENIDPSSQADVLINSTIFTEDTGRIMKWSLLVSTKNVAQAFGKIPAPTLHSWSQTKAGEKDMYQATEDNWMPFEMKGSMLNGRVETHVIYTLGKDANCKPESGQFCNGPLNPGSEYTVMLRAQTAAGYRDLSKMHFKTAPNYKLTIILVCVFVFILVIVVSFVLITMRRRQHGWPRKLMVTLFGMAEETQAPRQCKPIPLEKFGAHYETVTEIGPSGETRLAEEFRLLASLSPPNVVANPAAYSTALAPDNKFKNRYINILPYDETRVKISVVDDDPSSSYINASLIKGYSGEVEYIASQGPKLETCEDFWRMVFEHDVTVIVMVTNLTEKGKDKCHQYYPNLRETKDFCFISVKCTTEINFPVYTSRTLLVQKESLQKTVVQLHFREWPDFGCPVSTDLMLSLCQNVRHQYSRNEGLILVHCSAGVGRTGTLIAVDILLQHMREHKKKLDVFGTVLKMRHQRINMVQTEGQYAYIYQCMKDALEDPSLLNSDSSPNNSLDPIYANVSVARVSEVACDSLPTSPSLEGSEPDHKKFISPELVTLASECSEDFPPPPDELEEDEVEYENFQREEEPEYENFPPPMEEPEYKNFPSPIEQPEYKNFPMEDEPEYGNFVGSLINISPESKIFNGSSAEMICYPMIATEDSDKETVL